MFNYSIGATSIPVSSFTANASYAAGTQVAPQGTLDSTKFGLIGRGEILGKFRTASPRRGSSPASPVPG